MNWKIIVPVSIGVTLSRVVLEYLSANFSWAAVGIAFVGSLLAAIFVGFVVTIGKKSKHE